MTSSAERMDIIDIRFMGILFIVIIALISMARTTIFNTAFKTKEDSEFSYQKIAVGSLVMLIFVHFL